MTSPSLCYAHTAPGIEEIAWLEIRDRFPQDDFGDFLFAKNKNGIVLFAHGGSLDDLLTLRTTEDVFLRGLYLEKVSRGWRDLQQVHELIVEGGDFGRMVNDFTRFRRKHLQSYHVVTRKFGKHEYKLGDFQQTVIQAIQERYPEWQGMRRGLEDQADVEIWANLLGSQVLLGARLPREGQPATSPAGLPPTIAAAAIHLTRPDAGDVFLDPLCGDGALVQEWLAVAGSHVALAGDRFVGSVQRAHHHSEPGATFCHWDAGALPVAANSATAIASHLPPAAALYEKWLGEMGRVLRPGGRAVVISTQFEQIKDALRHVPALQLRTGYSVRVQERWGRIYVLQTE